MVKISEPNIIIRPYQEGDEIGISQLMFNNFPSAMNAEMICKTWLWQFKNEFSKYPAVMIASSNNEIIAHYGLMKVKINYQGRIIDGAVSSATVTDKKFRGKGLFTKLSNATYKSIQNEGCKIIFGFPNSQSFHGFIKNLNWFEICDFPALIKPLRFYPFIQKIVKVNFLSRVIACFGKLLYTSILKIFKPSFTKEDIEILSVDQIREDITSLWKNSYGGKNIAVTRNKDYIEWRYFKKPFFKYNIDLALSRNSEVGYLITLLDKMLDIKILYIMELVTMDDDPIIYNRLLQQAEEMARKQDADAVSILSLRNNPNYSLLLRNGFLPVYKKMLPQGIYFGARINDKDIDKRYVQDSKNWYISWGDLDVV